MLLEQLRTDAILARKAAMSAADPAQKATKRHVGILLTTIVSMADMAAKNDGQRPAADEDAVTALRKTIKGIDDTMALVPEGDDARMKFLAEKEILSTYLPTMLSPDELRNAIRAAANVAGVPVEMRSMKTIMELLSKAHPSKIDARAVSSVIKDWGD